MLIIGYIRVGRIYFRRIDDTCIFMELRETLSFYTLKIYMQFIWQSTEFNNWRFIFNTWIYYITGKSFTVLCTFMSCFFLIHNNILSSVILFISVHKLWCLMEVRWEVRYLVAYLKWKTFLNRSLNMSPLSDKFNINPTVAWVFGKEIKNCHILTVA